MDWTTLAYVGLTGVLVGTLLYGYVKLKKAEAAHELRAAAFVETTLAESGVEKH